MLSGEFLNKLAKKAGVKLDNPALVALLAVKEFATAEIPDELANTIDSALMDLEAAKAHPEVIKKIKTETLNGADKVIEDFLTGAGYSDDEIADIRAEKNTFAKITKAATKIKDLESKKAAAPAADKAALQKQIDDAKADLRKAAEVSETAINDLKASHTVEMTDMNLKMILASKTLSLPKEMDPALKTQVALAAVKADLTAKGFQIVNTNGVLEVKKTDGTDAYNQTHQKIGLIELIDGALAQQKLLAVNEPTPPGGPIIPIIPGQPPFNANADAIALIEQQITDGALKV